MQARFTATDPDDMPFTLTVTMKLSEWKKLREQTSADYPGRELRHEIVKMVLAAERHFLPEDGAA